MGDITKLPIGFEIHVVNITIDNKYAESRIFETK
jgi:hypothetical protein